MRVKPPPSLLHSWTSGRPAPAYVLGGEGARLAEMLAEGMVDRFRKKGEKAELVHWSVPDLEKESPEAVWRSPSFFVRWRVFLLPDAGDWKQGARREIVSYLASPDPAILLVIPCAERRAMTAFSSVGGLRAAFLGEEDVVAAMSQFAVSRAEEGGKVLSGEAAAFLARWIGADFARFRTELDKLLSFAGTRSEIGEEEIRAVCVAGGAVDPFRLADDLISRNGKGWIEKFRRFSASADSGDYHALLGAIAWSVRRRIAGASSRGKGIPPGGRTGPFTAERGAEILQALSRIDRDLKGGSRLSPEQVFEIRLLKLL